MRELILGGQKSGKSRLAEERARAWLAQSASHKAVLIATGLAHDEEMRERIARHQADRLLRLPELRCVEEAVDLGDALRTELSTASNAKSLVVIDCITMWLTNLLMPSEVGIFKKNEPSAGALPARSAIDLVASLHDALAQVGQSNSHVVIVSNEIGLGVIPMGAQVRHFVDELGKLNQSLAAQCEHVTLMAAGCALTLKGAS